MAGHQVLLPNNTLSSATKRMVAEKGLSDQPPATVGKIGEHLDVTVTPAPGAQVSLYSTIPPVLSIFLSISKPELRLFVLRLGPSPRKRYVFLSSGIC